MSYAYTKEQSLPHKDKQLTHTHMPVKLRGSYAPVRRLVQNLCDQMPFLMLTSTIIASTDLVTTAATITAVYLHKGESVAECSNRSRSMIEATVNTDTTSPIQSSSCDGSGVEWGSEVADRVPLLRWMCLPLKKPQLLSISEMLIAAACLQPQWHQSSTTRRHR